MLFNITKKAPSSHFWGLWSPDSCVSENLYTKICMEDFDNFAPSVPSIINYYGKLGRYCTFRRAGEFLKRENLSSAVDVGLPPYILRYRLEIVFRTKLSKTGTQQVPSRVPSYYGSKRKWDRCIIRYCSTSIQSITGTQYWAEVDWGEFTLSEFLIC